jgi:hypothetical protein
VAIKTLFELLPNVLAANVPVVQRSPANAYLTRHSRSRTEALARSLVECRHRHGLRAELSASSIPSVRTNHHRRLVLPRFGSGGGGGVAWPRSSFETSHPGFCSNMRPVTCENGVCRPRSALLLLARRAPFAHIPHPQPFTRSSELQKSGGGG